MGVVNSHIFQFSSFSVHIPPRLHYSGTLTASLRYRELCDGRASIIGLALWFSGKVTLNWLRQCDMRAHPFHFHHDPCFIHTLTHNTHTHTTHTS